MRVSRDFTLIYLFFILENLSFSARWLLVQKIFSYKKGLKDESRINLRILSKSRKSFKVSRGRLETKSGKSRKNRRKVLPFKWKENKLVSAPGLDGNWGSSAEAEVHYRAHAASQPLQHMIFYLFFHQRPRQRRRLKYPNDLFLPLYPSGDDGK